MSVAPDGSDRRVEFTASIALAQVYNGRFYLVVAKGDPKNPREYLVCLHPENGNSMETLAALLPGATTFQFDERYLYFETIRDENRRLVDWLLADPDRVERVRRLYRVRLPD